MSKMSKLAFAALLLAFAQQSVTIAEEKQAQQALDADLTAAIESNCQKESANAADPQAAFAQCVEEGKKIYENSGEKG